MTKFEIINIIRDIEKEFKSYKDGGLSFIKHLADKLLNTIDEDKNDVINFFLDEIKNNENRFGEIALLTLVEMKALELAPYIEGIFNEVATKKDENWKQSIIEALMKLRYVEPKALYYEYVTSFLSKQPDNAFFLLVQYCNVDPANAIPLLSEFYVKNLLRNVDMQGFLESRIGFLVSYFIENPGDNLFELNKLVLLKNRNVGQHLKKILLCYFGSSMAEKYPKDLIEKEKRLLYSL